MKTFLQEEKIMDRKSELVVQQEADNAKEMRAYEKPKKDPSEKQKTK